MNTYIQLGRTGDIIHLLPALYHEFKQTGQKPFLMVAKKFAEVLEGVSYVTPIIYDGDFRDINQARQLVKKGKVAQVVGNKAIVAQVYGTAYTVPYYADSFVKDSWRLAGFEGLWRENLPLVFDKRDAKREKKLSSAINPRKLPYILMFTEGHSSPFKHERLLGDMVKVWFPDHLIIRNPQAEKIFDLVGLMEKADCIFATDSAPLHLAQAVRTPVVALAADKPSLWHGSPMRRNHIHYSRYSSFPEEIPAVWDSLQNLDKHTDLIHVFSNYAMTGDAFKRYVQSRATWRGYQLGLTDSATNRGINTTPFIRDMLRLACVKADPKSIIILHNSDTSFYEDAHLRIIDAVQKHESCFSFRNDYEGEPRVMAHADPHIPYEGCDMFAFTKRWWQANCMEMPDMLLGREGWDYILRHIILNRAGVCLPDTIYHFRHPTHWEQNPRDSGNELNRKLALRYMRMSGMPMEHPWDKYRLDNLNR